MNAQRKCISTTSEKRRCVLVVGLLPGQEAQVRRAVADNLALRFLPADRRPHIPAGCAEVVLMTKFIGHEWQRKAYSGRPRELVHLHHGGLATLVRWLAQVALRCVAIWPLDATP